MNKPFKQLVREAHEMRLDANEKADIKHELMLSMGLGGGAVRNNVSGRHNFWSMLVPSINTNNLKYMPLIIAIIIALGGGTSFAAQNSLPGEALYQVKLNVNERVEKALAVSERSQAEVEAKFATRRLEEAEKLSAKSELSAEVKQQIEANFKAHADRVQERVEKFQDSEAGAEVSARFETSLRAHEKILLNIASSKDGSSEPHLRSLASKVGVEANDSARIKVSEETKVRKGPDVQQAAEGKMGAAKNKIVEVKKYIAAHSSDMGAAATVAADARVKLAEDTFAQGKVKLDAKAYGEAFLLFQKAQSIAQEAKILIQAKAELEAEDKDRESSSPKPSSSGSGNKNQVESRGKLEIQLGL